MEPGARWGDKVRAATYRAASTLLPPGPVAVIDLDCRDGRGKFDLGPSVKYTGLERSRTWTPHPLVNARTGFNWVTRDDTPGGFDVAICVRLPWYVRASAAVYRVGSLAKKDGLVIFGLKQVKNHERLKRAFEEVTVYRQGQKTFLAACRGLKTGSENANG